MRTLNLGILAHVDAGKTTLTERLLYTVGVLDKPGSVDEGSTHTDALALERQRGITIKSAVVSFVVDNVAINLIDTPGHPDFIAEVERVLCVLDGAVLVVSAVEGVQAQSRVLMRTLRRLNIPALLFVNKIDRRGAQDDSVLRSISERLTSSIVPMGTVTELGTRSAGFIPYTADDADFVSSVTNRLADHDDAILTAYVEEERGVPYDQLRETLAAQTGQALVHPVYFGSAITGVGVDPLIRGMTELLPAAEGDMDGPVSGTVFKIERGPAGEKIAYVRLFSGVVRVRDRVRLSRVGEAKITAIDVFDRGSAVRRHDVASGQIGKLWGLRDVQIGDAIGPAQATSEHYFAPPTLETVVVPRRSNDRGALHTALTQLAEQDPLINLRRDDIRQEISVSLYGEVQKQIIQATLANEYGLDVDFLETTTICIERPVGNGTAMEILLKGANPFPATVGLRVEPAPIDTGIQFRMHVAIDGIPIHVYKDADSFRASIEKTVRNTLQQGIHGWQVTDCAVTMTDSGFTPGTIAKHFRLLTPLVLMAALVRAGTVVCEPIHRFHFEAPADSVGSVLPMLAQLRAVPQPPAIHGSLCTLEGDIPASRVHELQQQLAGLTRGEGVLESAFNHHEPVRGTPPPTRPRTDYNPLNRQEYLRRARRGG